MIKLNQDRYGSTIGEPHWVAKNIETMMGRVMLDVRNQKPPTRITMHPLALARLIQILKSKAAYFPREDGSFEFIGIPVNVNSSIPRGTFVVEGFSDSFQLKRRR